MGSIVIGRKRQAGLQAEREGSWLFWWRLHFCLSSDVIMGRISFCLSLSQ